MAKKQVSGKISSNSAKAKNAIRAEMRRYYSPSVKGYGRSTLENIRARAEDTKDSLPRYARSSNYARGKKLVDNACFAYACPDQAVLLGKIYGKDKVKGWSCDKTHETYKHLIGREYDAMVREDAAKKARKLAEREKAKEKRERERAKQRAFKQKQKEVARAAKTPTKTSTKNTRKGKQKRG